MTDSNLEDVKKRRKNSWTPMSNQLIDDLMPNLRDTEFRILVVVLRQTSGRLDRNSGKSKIRDWLTQRQLMTRTGRASEAVSSAIDSLVNRGLLVVTTEGGKVLSTSADRRRHLGRLYYRVSSEIIGPNSSVIHMRIRKANSEKRIQQ